MTEGKPGKASKSASDVVHVRDVLRFPLYSYLPKVGSTDPGTLVCSVRGGPGPNSPTPTPAPGIYLCVADGGMNRSWHRLSYDFSIPGNIKVQRSGGTLPAEKAVLTFNSGTPHEVSIEINLH